MGCSCCWLYTRQVAAIADVRLLLRHHWMYVLWCAALQCGMLAASPGASRPAEGYLEVHLSGPEVVLYRQAETTLSAPRDSPGNCQAQPCCTTN